MSKFKEQLKAYFSDQTLRGKRILSIGAQEDDKKYFASVECEEWLTLDKNNKFNPNITFDMNRQVQGEGGFEIADNYMEAFDIIIAFNLWEYIYAPMTASSNLMDLLKPGGTLITNFPFIYPLHNPVGQDFLRYTPEGVEKLLKMAGFKIEIHDYIYAESPLLISFYQADGLKARSNFDHRIIGSIIKAKK